MIVLIRK